MNDIDAATADPSTRSIVMGQQTRPLTRQIGFSPRRDETALTWWLQKALARKYDSVLAEPVPQDLEQLLDVLTVVN